MPNVALEVGKVYTFNTKAPSVLGVSVTNAKLTSIIDYESAVKFDNIDLKFRSIYPLLPNGTPDTPESCLYYKFKTESGETIILANVWIDLTSVAVIQHINFQVTFSNASLEDITRVRAALSALGYTNYVIKQTT
jgi:hypothetical protein